MYPKYFITAGLLLVLIGMLTITYGLLKVAERGRVEGGGIVVIGPFPIAFGTSETIAKAMLLVGVVLAVLSALLLLRAM